MEEKDIMQIIYKETIFFFENILISKDLQKKYNLNPQFENPFVLKTIEKFKNYDNCYIVKPFYEKDCSKTPRSLFIKRDKSGFIVSKLNGLDDEFSVIEPLRFVSILKQFVEDEEINKAAQKNIEADKSQNDLSL